jgi:hypothetical protein
MLQKSAIALLVFLATLVALPLVSAFEAHVLNVTAQIENALTVPVKEIEFGLVFPQEEHELPFSVSLSDSFIADRDVDDVEYVLRQKPKCWNNNPQTPLFGRAIEDAAGNFICEDAGFVVLPLLCPYLSKHETSEDGTETENDESMSAFHGRPGPWTIATTLAHELKGRLAKSASDLDDNWLVDLKVPCFGSGCAQDWADFVHAANPDPDVNPADYIEPATNMGALYGCDLWLEVTGISKTAGCTEVLDLMLVLDRSGSIDATELATLKSAAHSFVTALAPSESGVHVGQSSFSTTGTLDLHLTGISTDVDAAIDALAAGGFTNLKEGIEFASGELDDTHIHERPPVHDVMVILTDGAPNRPVPATAATAAKAAADAARAAGVEVFVVGIGVSASTEAYLRDDIADDAAHYFSAGSFGDLELLLADLPVCGG